MRKLPYRGSEYTKFKKLKLKKEDEVICISGKDKGKKGKILLIDKKRDRVVVTGLNKVKRFIKPDQEHPQGTLVEVERPIHISNVQKYDSDLKKGVRIGYKINGINKVRVSRPKKNQKEV